MTNPDILSHTPLNNYVVLKPEIDTGKFKYGTVEFFMPLSLADGKPYDQFRTRPIVCSIVSVPRKLIYGKHKVYWETIDELDLPPEQKMYLHKLRKETKFSEITLIDAPIPGSMRWKTKVQVKQGDIVWVNSSALVAAEQNYMTFENKKQLYYIVKYEELYLKKADKDVKMLNGWVLVELINDVESWMMRAEKAGIFMPNTVKKKYFNDRIGIVKYIGDPVEYLFDDQYDHHEVKAGSMVFFKWKVNRRLEPGMKYFAKDQDLTVTRRSNILGIME